MSADGFYSLVEAIKRNLAEGRYQNESAIREAVVLPVLQKLGWDTIEPYTVRREHNIRGRKSGLYAFCSSENTRPTDRG